MDTYTPLTHCFDKHPFTELNNIDISLLRASLRHYIRAHPEVVTTGTFFDVGTNAGSFVKALQSEGITRNIHCFEPHPVLSEKVKATYPDVIMNKFCLGNSDTPVTLYIPEFSCGLSSLIKRPVFEDLKRTGQVIVPYETTSTTLDNYCSANTIDKIDFIKIDVEGAEKMVFEGASRMLREKRINAGLFEIGMALTDAGTSTEEIVEMLDRCGYSILTQFSKSDIYFYKAD